MTTVQEPLTSAWKTTESDRVTTNPARRETEDEKKEECLAATVAPTTEGKQLVLLQIKCSSIYNKTLDFWNLIDTYKPDVIGTELRLSEEISSAVIFMDDCTTIRRDRHTVGGGVFTCVKNCIT